MFGLPPFVFTFNFLVSWFPLTFLLQNPYNTNFYIPYLLPRLTLLYPWLERPLVHHNCCMVRGVFLSFLLLCILVVRSKYIKPFCCSPSLFYLFVAIITTTSTSTSTTTTTHLLLYFDIINFACWLITPLLLFSASQIALYYIWMEGTEWNWREMRLVDVAGWLSELVGRSDRLEFAFAFDGKEGLNGWWEWDGNEWIDWIGLDRVEPFFWLDGWMDGRRHSVCLMPSVDNNATSFSVPLYEFCLGWINM